MERIGTTTDGRALVAVAAGELDVLEAVRRLVQPPVEDAPAEKRKIRKGKRKSPGGPPEGKTTNKRKQGAAKGRSTTAPGEAEKRCAVCKGAFLDSSRTKSRKVCFNPACKREMKRRWTKKWAAARAKAAPGAPEAIGPTPAKRALEDLSSQERMTLTANPALLTAEAKERRLELLKELDPKARKTLGV